MNTQFSQTILRTSQLAIATFIVCAVTAIASPAQTFTSLFSFDGSHGAYPVTPVVQGLDGGMYGTTPGEIYRITPEGQLGVIQTNLRSPNALVLAANGDFYGTTLDYAMYTCGIVGQESCGSVFSLSPRNQMTTLFSFNPPTEGKYPSALVQGIDGNFYGTTEFGGANNCGGTLSVGCGTVFKVTPAGQMTTIHNFCSQKNCLDGNLPGEALVLGPDGAFYGTTRSNGYNASPYGTIFRITPSGQLTTLHSFCLTPACADGNGPVGALVLGSDGNLYGTTQNGGGDDPAGGIYKITPTGVLTPLYSFCLQTGCADGNRPIGGLIQATDGNFYGVTSDGGDTSNCSGFGCGTIFRMTPGGTLTTLHRFESTDGSYPAAGLLQRTDGNFYGTTNTGGSGCGQGCGTVFSLSTGLGPFVSLVRPFGKIGQTGGILGQGFTGTTGVFLNGTSASFTVVSDTAIRLTVPMGATSGYITVATPSGTLTSNVTFQVLP